MDYFQGVVTEYLVADRSAFVNTELLIQLDPDEPLKNRHWYCDAAAVSFREETLFLCEVTYSKSMAAIAKRLLAWDSHWTELRDAMLRDCNIPLSWHIHPWAFIPGEYCDALRTRIASLAEGNRSPEAMPYPRITFLEAVVPWNYVTWDRKITELENGA